MQGMDFDKWLRNNAGNHVRGLNISLYAQHTDNCAISRRHARLDECVCILREKPVIWSSIRCLKANDRRRNSRLTGWGRVEAGLNRVYMAWLTSGMELQPKAFNTRSLAMPRKAGLDMFQLSSFLDESFQTDLCYWHPRASCKTQQLNAGILAFYLAYYHTGHLTQDFCGC